VFRGQTRTLGSPCDLLLAIKTLDGQTLVVSDPGSPADAALTNGFPETADYILEVRELSAQNTAPYRIKAAPFVAGATASSEVNRLEVKLEGETTLKVNVSRFDYSGEVRLELEPQIAGLNLSSNVVKEKQSSIDLKLKASAPLRLGQLIHFKLKVITSDAHFARFTSTTAALRKTFPLMLYPPPALQEVFSVAIKRE
jgi:hypothetical protein